MGLKNFLISFCVKGVIFQYLYFLYFQKLKLYSREKDELHFIKSWSLSLNFC